MLTLSAGLFELFLMRLCKSASMSGLVLSKRRRVIRKCLERFQINRPRDVHLRSVSGFVFFFKLSLLCCTSAESLYIFLHLHWALHKQSLNCLQLRAGASVKVPEGLSCADLSETSVCILYSPILLVLVLTHAHTRAHTHTHFFLCGLHDPLVVAYIIASNPATKRKVILKFRILF